MKRAPQAKCKLGLASQTACLAIHVHPALQAASTSAILRHFRGALRLIQCSTNANRNPSLKCQPGRYSQRACRWAEERCCAGYWWYPVYAPHAVPARCTVARSCKRPLCSPGESCAGSGGAQGRSSTSATGSDSILQADRLTPQGGLGFSSEAKCCF